MRDIFNVLKKKAHLILISLLFIWLGYLRAIFLMTFSAMLFAEVAGAKHQDWPMIVGILIGTTAGAYLITMFPLLIYHEILDYRDYARQSFCKD